MNGSVLAALVVAALLVVVLMLKNRASQKKSMESETDEQPARLIPQPEDERAEAVEPAVMQEDVAAAVVPDEPVSSPCRLQRRPWLSSTRPKSCRERWRRSR